MIKKRLVREACRPVMTASRLVGTLYSSTEEKAERKKCSMKKIILLCMIICFLLCSCGKNSPGAADTISKKSIPSAEKYEVEWVDTSKLASVYNILASEVESQVYFIQSILVSRDEDGRMEQKYEEISYDMISGEWSDAREFPVTDKINQKGLASSFQVASDGTWYFLLLRWNEKSKKYDDISLSRMTEEEEIEEVKIPEDLLPEKVRVDSYRIRNDGKICIKVYPKSRFDEGDFPEEMNVILYDPEKETFDSAGDLLMGSYDMLSIENEYFYRSVAGGGCGYAVKNPDTGDVAQREIFCAGDTPEGGWTNDSVFTVYDTCDEENNLYVLNAGGIYGCHYTGNELKNIVPASVLGELNFSTQGDMDQKEMRFISHFWRGAETAYADFYVLITDTADDTHIKVTLAHIKKKD